MRRIATWESCSERQVVNGMAGVNRPKRGEQLAEDKEIDGVECEMNVARNSVALNRATDAAALSRVQLLAKLIKAAVIAVKSRVTCGWLHA
jgi:hypothetical protein